MKQILGMLGGGERSEPPTPLVKPGIVIPGIRLLFLGLGQVEWLVKGSWVLRREGIPLSHYFCYNCLSVYPIAPVRKSEMRKCFDLP